MLRGSIGLLVVVLSLTCQGQSWCPPGATWTYEGAISQYTTNRITRYVGDTILGGENAQTLFTVHQFIHPVTQAVDTFGGEGTYSWTRASGEVIWLWSATESAWDTLYNFGAAPGSEWGPVFAEPGFCGSPEAGDKVQVLDTGTMVVQGVPLRYLDIHLGSYGGRVTERMGWSVMMETFEGCWQDLLSEFKCYEDYEIDYSVDPDQGSCDLATRIENRDLAEPILYPNPGNDHITISRSSGPHTIALFDATGRMVLQQRTNDTRPVISTEALPAGLYRITVRDGLGGLMSATWVKE